MRLPYLPLARDADVMVVGIPFDTGTTFRTGARFGPEAIRARSLLLRPYHPVLDVAHSIQVGIRGPLYGPDDMQGSRDLGFQIVTTPEVHDNGVPWALRRIVERVGDRPTYISWDIDCVDPAFAPGTGTPEVGGF